MRGGLVRCGHCRCGVGGGGCGGGGGGVLGGAFGLEFGGVENAVVSVGTDGEGLGVVFEGVGRRFGALIDHGEFAALLEQIKGGVGADAMDAAWGYVAGDSEVPDVGIVSHALQFADGDVVAFVVATAAERKVSDGAEDDDGGDDEFERAFSRFVCHTSPFASLRLIETGGPPPYLFLRKVFKKLDLGLDFDDEAVHQKKA